VKNTYSLKKSADLVLRHANSPCQCTANTLLLIQQNVFWVAISIALASTLRPCFAQNFDAGSLQQQLERENRNQVQRPPPSPVVPTPYDPFFSDPSKPNKPLNITTPQGGPQVTLQKLEWLGNQLISSGLLSERTEIFLHRALNFDDLQKLARYVEAVYKDQGFLASVSLPVQEINQATLKIQILEAKTGQLKVSGKLSRISNDQLKGALDNAPTAGEALSLVQTERAMLLLSDLPGVALRWGYVAGEHRGETDVELELEDQSLSSLNIGADNLGAHSTGANRVSASLNLYSPLRLGDLSEISLIDTLGSHYAHLSYSLPFTSQGLRAGINLSSLDYTVTATDLSALHPSGSFKTSGLFLSAPLLRTQSQNLSSTLSIDNKVFQNTNIASSNNYSVDETNLLLAWSNTYSSDLAIRATLDWTQGRLIPTQNAQDEVLGTLPSVQSAQTTGNFSKLLYQIGGQAFLSQRFSLFTQLQGQEASRNLDSSEKIYLGGLYGVRAYPSGEAGGTHGEILNLEGRYQLSQSVRIDGFYDWGVIEQYKNNFSQTISPGGIGLSPQALTAANNYSLAGYGLQLSWQSLANLDKSPLTPQVSLKVVLARRVGSNPNPSLVGTDQDGTLTKNRIWFLATLRF